MFLLEDEILWNLYASGKDLDDVTFSQKDFIREKLMSVMFKEISEFT